MLSAAMTARAQSPVDDGRPSLAAVNEPPADDDGPSWEEIYEQVVLNTEDEDDGAAAWEENYELLRQLAEQPLDLNSATRSELEQLPFLSARQVMDLIEYRDRYHGFRSMGELRMVRSMDYAQLRLLPCFVRLGPAGSSSVPGSASSPVPGSASSPVPVFGNIVAANRTGRPPTVAGNSVAGTTYGLPPLAAIARHGRHELTATARLPFYDRRGDRNGYLGYKYRHWLRYELRFADRLRMGITASQDAGEPFLANCNRWGYDTYNYYLQQRSLSPVVDNLIVGKYKLSVGMGLVANTSFALGKLATLQSLGRHVQQLRPHASRSTADYFQGAATTLRLSKPLRLTLFASWRPVDATLNDDSARTAATLITSGYHRTATEISKKNNTHLTSAGTAVTFRSGALRLGLNAVYTHTDRPLEPNRTTLYRRHYAHGSDFLNASLDYGFTHYLIAFSGETATDAHGHLATVNALSITPLQELSIVALQRFYSYRYTALHAHSFSEGGRVQNESGVYLGIVWQPLHRLHLQAYADYASFPWARYQVSKPSDALDLLLQATVDLPRWTLMARYRAHLREKDNDDHDALIPCDDHRLRLTATYADPSSGWSLKTQADAVHSVYKATADGIMIAEQVGWQRTWLQLRMTAAWFHTDDYQSRLYLYEPHLQGDFAFPTYYGHGLRLALMARADIGRRLRLALRLGYTDYFDRPTIGTGLQRIDHSSMTDLDLQLRWKF